MKKWPILFVLVAVLASNCGFAGKRIKGNREVVSENRNLVGFEEVTSTGSFDVYVSAGTSTALKIEAESNIMPYIEAFVENNTLVIKSRDKVWLSPRKPVKVYVTAPRFRKIISNGTGDIIGQTLIADSSKLQLEVQGNGKINMQVDAPEVAVKVNGNGGVYLKGQSRYFNCEVLGNGNLKAYELKAEETKVRITGNGDAQVYASVKLDVSVTGNGDVHYKGNAQPSTHITGNGGIHHEQ